MKQRHTDLVFGLAQRLGCFAWQIEALSVREVDGWIAHFNRQADDAHDDDALDMANLDRAQLRAMFHR
jgi:hypothetical protein